MEDIQTLKPTIFCGVPRVYDRVYAGKARMFIALRACCVFLIVLSIEFILNVIV